jgi:peptidoglycan/xylan/chitin deacetylase (PgdA/CDA1 family)
MIDLVHLVGTHLPRRVARYFPDVLWRVGTRQRVVYLTFDDGPTEVLTGPLLDLLARYEAEATFFLLGRHARRHPELVRALASAGHSLGNHTFTHPDAWRASASVVLGELERTTRLLEDLAQTPVRLMRPPYGRFTQAMRQWCQVRRHRCTMWDVGPGDFLSSATPALIERRILGAVRPGSIIALHDNPKARASMPPALATVLRTLKGDGWRFAAL